MKKIKPTLFAAALLALVLAPSALAQSADLSVTKTGSAVANAGDDVPYTVTVTNLGPAPATGITLTDVIPEGMEFVSATQESGPEFVCSAPPAGEGGTVTCTAPAMLDDETAVFTFVFHIRVENAPGASFENTASVTSPSADPNSGNNSDTVITTLEVADLALTKEGPTEAAAGDPVSYTITVVNLGPDTARDITITDNLPTGMTFVSATQDSGPAFSCTTPDPGDPGAVICSAQTMTSGTTAVFTFVFEIPAEASPGTSFTNIVTVTSAFDPSDENNTGVIGTTIPVPMADLAVTKEGQVAAGPGTDIVYIINLINGGPNAAENLTLTDTLPGTLTFVSFEQNSGSPLNCTTPAVGAGGTINCTAATFPTGTAVFTLTANVPADTETLTEFTNSAFASTSTFDPNEENNGGSFSTIVAPVDLAVTKTGPETATEGDQIAYMITLTNSPAGPASDVTLTDVLPAGTRFVSFERNTGPIPSCTTPNPFENGTVTCTYGFFNANTTATFTLTVLVGDVAEITNTVTVMTGENFDTDETNDTDSVITTVAKSADVSVAKSGPATANAGENVVYTILVSNEGPSAAESLTLTDVLPAGTTFVSLTPPDGPTFDCTTPAAGANGTVTCTIAPFPAGVTSTFQLIVDVGQDVAAGTVLSNTAAVSTTTPDPDSGNDQSTVNTTTSTNAELLVTKAANSHVDAGSNLTYFLGVTNSGPSPAANVTLTDVVPAGTTFVSNTQTAGPTFDCTTPAPGGTGTVTCTIAELDPFVSAAFTLIVAVPASTPRDTVISNTATGTSSTPSNPDNHPNQATVGVTVALTSDLSVIKTAPATVNAGQTLSYTITTANGGPSDAPSTTLEDVLPAGTTFVSILQDSGPTFNCTTPAVGANGTVTCTLASFPAGDSAAFTLVVAVDPALAGGTTLDNTATVGAQAFDPDSDDRQSTASTTVNTSADLGVTKSITPGGSAGGTITYTVTATNAGPSAAANVTLTDVLPSEVTFVSLNQISDPAFNCTTPAVGANGTITCTLASFESGDTATFQIVVEVAQSVPEGTLIANTATIDSDTPDPDPSDDSDTASEGVITVADVGVTKSAPETVVAGETLTWTINATNAGPSAARTVTLTDPLPEGTTFISLSQPSGPTFNCTTPAAGANGTITCTLATLNEGETTTFSIVVRVSPDVANGTTLPNDVTISTTESDPDASNDTAGATTTVTTSADVSVAKTGPATATATDNVTYTVTVANAGPSAAQTVTLTDVVPANTTFVSATQTSGPTFNCTTPAAGATGTITCTIASLAANATAVFEFVVNVSPSTPNGTVITNTATVSSTTSDPDATDQTATATTNSATSADVGVTKSGPATVTAGSNATYTVTVTNEGPTEALSVTLTDAVPANTTFVSATQTSGPTFNCTTPAAGATGTITCTIASLDANAIAIFEFVVSVSVSAPDGTVITNTAVVSSTTPDPDPSNQTATATTNSATSADVGVTKGGPAMATAGSNATYTVTVTNEGPTEALSVTLTDAVPANTTFVSATQTGGPTFICTTPAAGATGTITCTIVSLAANDTATFDFVVNISSSTPDGTVITNSAVVASVTPDPDTTNQTGTATTTVGTGADVSISKSGPATITSGSDITYTVSVSNAGPSNALNVTATDVMPEGTTFVSVTQTGGPTFDCTTPAAGANGTITCTIASLAPNTTSTFELVFHVEPGTVGPIQNTASVSSPTDTSPANDAGSTSAAVAAGPTDVSIDKTASATSVGPAGTVTYTIVVRNNGPDNAEEVVVTDTLPAGTTLSSASSTHGTCSGTTTITCNVGTLAPTVEATITLVVDFPATPGSFTNTASVDIGNVDTNPVNDSDNAVVSVAAAAQIPTLSPFALIALALALASVVLLRIR